jgi:uncharacterized protein YbjT (DUF2867 family)
LPDPGREQHVRIIIVGVTGFIGSATSARLVADGQEVIGVSRGQADTGPAPIRHVSLDLAASTPDDWLGVLDGVEAVVNCAGTLQDAPGESTHGVHVKGLAALIAACEQRRVRRFIHLSASGVDQPASAFSQSKRAGEAALAASTLDWIILRPSVVVGRAAYGGSALMRGIAALPVQPVMPAAGPLELVHLDDVVETIAACLKPETPGRRILELVGPKRFTFDEAVRFFRRWLRFPPARNFAVPGAAAALLYRAGDTISLLGWRPPVRTTAQREIVRGATGDPAAWRETTGIVPRNVEAAFAREPASVQERWFARLYILKPLIFIIFGLFWIATAYVSLGPGWDIGMDLMRRGGVGERMGAATVIAGALADLVIGCAILYRRTSRLGLYAALAISFAYAIIGTILVPELWRDPLGPMLKIWPIIMLNLVALAVLEDR